MMTALTEKAATGQPPWEPPQAESGDFETQYRAHMARLGAKGGQVSGAKRMKMPKAERQRIASLGAKAMWAKRKTGQLKKG